MGFMELKKLLERGGIGGRALLSEHYSDRRGTAATEQKTKISRCATPCVVAAPRVERRLSLGYVWHVGSAKGLPGWPGLGWRWAGLVGWLALLGLSPHPAPSFAPPQVCLLPCPLPACVQKLDVPRFWDLLVAAIHAADRQSPLNSKIS